jgi:glycosyltransferase involved in cell wall biosynthesis
MRGQRRSGGWRIVKVAILWTHLSGYLNASLKALAAVRGVEIYVANRATGREAPFSPAHFEWIPRRYEYEDSPDSARLILDLEAFRPDVIVASWHVKSFQTACMHFKSRAARVACADNQWRGSPRQRFAGLTTHFHLRKSYDAAFVAGERQAVWARHLGFAEPEIWRGLYAAEVDSFRAVAGERDLAKPSFLFAGRLAAEKGVATLAAAYEGYASGMATAGARPWECLVAGTGPLEAVLTHPGFIKLGFVQPVDLPRLFARATCFVLPSIEENWGVVVQEAAASGLPIICTQQCGASVHLVQDNYNGLLVEAGDAGQLQAALGRMTRLPADRWQQMSEGSLGLARQFTPERWAATILEKGSELRTLLRLPGSGAS